jgi:hypothetical protein
MLLSDGFHLSAPAHRKLGLALGELLKEAAGQKLAAASAGSAA